MEQRDGFRPGAEAVRPRTDSPELQVALRLAQIMFLSLFFLY